jgi:hypothetical protein
VVSCAFLFEMIALCVDKNGVHRERHVYALLFGHFGTFSLNESVTASPVWVRYSVPCSVP